MAPAGVEWRARQSEAHRAAHASADPTSHRLAP
jgi:hypothetical protein